MRNDRLGQLLTRMVDEGLTERTSTRKPTKLSAKGRAVAQAERDAQLAAQQVERAGKLAEQKAADAAFDIWGTPEDGTDP